MSDLPVLQAVRLKGRSHAAAVAACAQISEEEATSRLSSLVVEGLVTNPAGTFRLTPAGKSELQRLIERERGPLDQRRLTVMYHEFDTFNTSFKTLVTDWQIRDGAPNDHSDEAYDLGIVERLTVLSQSLDPWLQGLAEVAPRLSTYAPRFLQAMQQVSAGDTKFIARPTIDSYHTVWFELHEELIGLLGRTRAGEALAGRAN